MSENRILEVMEQLIYLRGKQDEEGLKDLLRGITNEVVSLSTVANAFLNVTDDIIRYIDASQAATETRMIDIIKALPEDVQTKIKASFHESEDDLLEEK